LLWGLEISDMKQGLEAAMVAATQKVKVIGKRREWILLSLSFLFFPLSVAFPLYLLCFPLSWRVGVGAKNATCVLKKSLRKKRDM
jgi:hypothetical protein